MEKNRTYREAKGQEATSTNYKLIKPDDNMELKDLMLAMIWVLCMLIIDGIEYCLSEKQVK